MAEEEDPVQSALREAEMLMEGIDLDTAPSIDGFAIDSDDEDDDAPLNPAAAAPPAHPLAAVSPVPSNGIASAPASGGSHPLAAAPNSGTSYPMTSPTAVGMGTPQQGMGFQQQHQHQQHQQPLRATTVPGGASLGGFSFGAAAPAAAPHMDAFKSKTSQFASSFVNMAQRAANQVSMTTPTAATVSTAGSTTPGSSGLLSSMSSNSFGLMSSTSGVNTPTAVATPPTTANMMQQQQQLPQQPMAPAASPELDQEQKELLIKTHVGDLLSGEKVIMFLSNLMHVSDSSGFVFSQQTDPSTMWCCCMTYYRVILFGTHPTMPPSRPHGWCASAWPSTQHKPALLQIPLSSIDKVEKSVFSASHTSLMGLALHSKHGHVIRYTTPSYPDTQRAYDALQTYAFPGRRNLGYLFAFESKREAVMASVVTDETTGAQSVTLPSNPSRFTVAEFERQFRHAAGQGGSVPWTIYHQLNQNYQVSASYPGTLVGPASLDDQQPEAVRILRGCAAFRSEGRMPSLTWSSGVDGASLWRAAQPKVGLQGNRSQADEIFLKHILESARSANAVSAAAPNVLNSLPRHVRQTLWGRPDAPNADPNVGLKIMDLRPRSAAMANRTGGYGYENVSYYPGATLQFCNIGNIHAVRDAHQKLQNLCLNPSANDIQWQPAVEDTKWLSHVRIILAASWEAAYWVYVHRLPVLIHCSHGWDRTSQVAVLSQLLLDPYYRTRKGFACLVEKDFMSFGHPFHTRSAHGEGRNDDKNNGNDEGQISPIFLQFLDCLYQLVSQYPECFEFNTKYVLLLSEHLYSCRFGNFLCDSEREREMLAGIRQRTHCVWDYLDHREDVVNPTYSAEKSEGVLLMPLPTLLRNVRLWTDRHCRHAAKVTTRYLPLGKEFPEDSDANHQSSDMNTDEELQKMVLGIDQEKPTTLPSPVKNEAAPTDGDAASTATDSNEQTAD